MESRIDRSKQVEQLSNEALEIKEKACSEGKLISFSDLPLSLPDGYIIDNKPLIKAKIHYEGRDTFFYRTCKNYPSKSADCRPAMPVFKAFCAHGTKFDSIHPFLCTNKQLVPGLKLRKLIGKRSDAGESQGTSQHNQKWISAVNFLKENHWFYNLALCFVYAIIIFKARKDTKTPRIPIVVLGESHTRLDEEALELSCNRINIRIISTFNPAEKAVVLGVLRALEIYDIHVCTLKELTTLENAPNEEKLTVLQTLYHENSEAACKEIGVSEYVNRAVLFDQADENSLSAEDKNILGSKLAAMLSQNEEEREVGLGYTPRSKYMCLVKEVMDMYSMPKKEEDNTVHYQSRRP